MKSCALVAKKIKSLSGAEIVQRIRDGDKVMIQALVMPHLAPKLSLAQIEEMYANGLAEACLGYLRFPEAIDVDTDVKAVPLLLLNILGNTLAGSPYNTPREVAKLNAIRLDVMRQLGPALLVCATKKRRLYGATEHWWGVRTGLMQLLQNCFLAQEQATAVLMNDLDPIVMNVLLDQVIFALTVDPTIFLRTKSPLLERSPEQNAIFGKMCTLSILVELVDIANVGEAMVCRIGTLIVPGGAPGLTGRKFAECFLECVARLAIAFSTNEQTRTTDMMIQRMQELHYIYSCLFKCPQLLPMLGPFDEAFTSADSPQSFLLWSRRRLGM